MKLSKEEQEYYDSLPPLRKLIFEYDYRIEQVPDNRYTEKQIAEIESALDKIAKIDEGIAGQLGEGLYSSAIAIGKK